MRKFRFSLQPVQILRDRQEQAALNVYARALQGAAEAEARLLAARQALEDAWAALRPDAGRPLSATALAQGHEHGQVLTRRADACAQALHAAQAAVAQAFSRWMTTRQNSAVLAKCRENQLREHRLRIRQHEQKQLDELGRRRPEGAAAGLPEEY
jgi:flagellar export protein FliJ